MVYPKRVLLGLFLAALFLPPASSQDLSALDHNEDGNIDSKDVLMFLEGWQQRDLYAPTPTPTNTLTGTPTLTPTPIQNDFVITFDSALLETRVREQLEKPSGDILFSEGMQIQELIAVGSINGRVGSLGGIESLQNLRRLSISDNVISDFTPLSSLPNLEFLFIGGRDETLSEVSTLQNIPSLKELDLSSNQLTHLPLLIGMTGLELLNLDQNSIVTLFSASDEEHLPLPTESGLVHIATLTITRQWFSLEGGGHRNLQDITHISELTSLKSLDLGRNSIIDTAPLYTMDNLRNLVLERNSIINLFSDLKHKGSKDMGLSELSVLDVSDQHSGLTSAPTLHLLPNLTELDLSHNALLQIPPLSDLNSLETIDLTDNKLSEATSFSGMDSLQTLLLANNSITSLTGMTGLPQLEVLELDGNFIRDIVPLGSFPNLMTLSMEETGISDLSPLATITSLEMLFLSHNLITNITPLGGLVNLGSLNLFDNRISDLTPLEPILPSLTTLNLRENRIVDLTGLVDGVSTMLPAGASLNLGNNPLSQTAVCDDIDTLERLGVVVSYTHNVTCP